MRLLDYALATILATIVGLALASMLGVALGPLDPAVLIGRVLDALG